MKYLVIFIAIVFCSCNEANVSNVENQAINQVKIIVIDQCQYLKAPAPYGTYTYTHKGNCNNPIHYTTLK